MRPKLALKGLLNNVNLMIQVAIMRPLFSYFSDRM